MLERQELFCHNCQSYVQFNLDTEMDGQYILNCPNGEPMPSKDWLIEDRLCKTSFPDCSECPVDTRIMCKYHEE